MRVRDDEGREGIGSGDLMKGFEGHEELFIGQDPRHLERHYEVLSHISFHYGRCWPMDLALWDLAGKITGTGLAHARRSGRQGPALCLLRRAARAVGHGRSGRAYIEEGFPAMKVRFLSAGGRGSWKST